MVNECQNSVETKIYLVYYPEDNICSPITDAPVYFIERFLRYAATTEKDKGIGIGSTWEVTT